MAGHADLRFNNAALYGKLGLSFERILKSSGIWDSIDWTKGSLYLNIKVKGSSERPVNLYQI
jgi:hypothetical protein